VTGKKDPAKLIQWNLRQIKDERQGENPQVTKREGLPPITSKAVPLYSNFLPPR
jgi:hypothetical protein